MSFEDESEDSLHPGTPLLQGQYVIESFLNAGGFGITYLARDSLDRTVVLKECFPRSMCHRVPDGVRARSRLHQDEFVSVVRLFGQEARRLAKLDHPNIVGVHQVFEDNGTAYMAMDFVEGRDLFDVIDQDPDRFGPDEIRDLLMSLLDAVAYVHDQNTLHRDISPDNILIRPDNQPVLIDFGAARDQARRASRVLSKIHVVKDGYSPQEFYLAGTTQTPASDLYSLAATFYHLITGAPPPDSHIRLAALAAKQPDPYVQLQGRFGAYDRYFLEAIDRALAVFPKDRLQSAAEWMEMLDVEERQRSLREQARHDKRIEARIRKLVRETNAIVREEQARAAEAAALRRAEEEAEARAREATRARILAEARAEAEEAARIAEEQALLRAEAARLAAEEAAREEAQRAETDDFIPDAAYAAYREAEHSAGVKQPAARVPPDAEPQDDDQTTYHDPPRPLWKRVLGPSRRRDRSIRTANLGGAET